MMCSPFKRCSGGALLSRFYSSMSTDYKESGGIEEIVLTGFTRKRDNNVSKLLGPRVCLYTKQAEGAGVKACSYC